MKIIFLHYPRRTRLELISVNCKWLICKILCKNSQQAVWRGIQIAARGVQKLFPFPNYLGRLINNNKKSGQRKIKLSKKHRFFPTDNMSEEMLMFGRSEMSEYSARTLSRTDANLKWKNETVVINKTHK